MSSVMDQIASTNLVLLGETTPLPVEECTYQPVNDAVIATRALFNRGNVYEAMQFGTEYSQLRARILFSDAEVLAATLARGDRITADDGVWTVDEIVAELPEGAGIIVSATRKIRTSARTA